MTRREQTAQYAVSVGNRQYRVEVQDSHLLVDGERVDFELTSLNGNGLHMFRRDERNTEMYFIIDGDSNYEVHVQGRRMTGQVDLAHRAARRSRTVRAEGDIVAPMPGLVVDVQVAVGQRVAHGDVLLMQESMKMQMLLRAPFDGRVEGVYAAAGEQVGKGALLVRLVSEEPVC